jgi:DNA adenine methylase
MKTFIKWSGNKSKHILKFKNYIPTEYNTYIEPFVGSGALFLYLKPTKWIINDKNILLIELWQIIKQDVSFFSQYYKQLRTKFLNKYTLKNKKEFCQKLLTELDVIKNIKIKAITYLFLKNCAYMGFITIHNNPCFYGLDLNILSKKNTFILSDNYIPNIQKISNFINQSNGKIYNKDYKIILHKAKSGDFVFLDPPYIEDKDYKFSYNKDDNLLDKNFIIELYNELQKLDKKNVKWLMTQADTPEVRQVFSNYTIKKYKVYRISMKKFVNELIIRNYS